MAVVYSLRRLYPVVALCAAMFSSGTTSGEQKNVPEGHLVKIGIVVKDKAGRGISSLRQEDFLLSEGASPKAISSFSSQEIPISYGLVVDATGSMRPVFSAEVAAAKAIVNTGRPGDEAFILRLIDGQAEVVADWTSDKRSLLDVLGGFDHAQGRMSVTDSLYFSADHFNNRQTAVDSPLRRTALVVLTDGQDSDSKHSLNQLVVHLKRQRLQVLAIGMYSVPPGAGIFAEKFHEKAVQFLKSLARDTNGYFTFPASPSQLQKAASEVLDYERSQYILGYISSGNLSADHLRVRVKLAGKVGNEGYSVSVRLPGQ